MKKPLLVLLLILVMGTYFYGFNSVNRPSVAPQISTSSSSGVTAYSPKHELEEADNGQTFIYSQTTRFGLVLDSKKYPKSALEINCTPQGVLGPISNIPVVAKPLDAVRYEAVQDGECSITDKDFKVYIEIK